MTMTTQELTKLLTDYTAQVFGADALAEVDVQPGVDSDGDAILYVDVVLRSEISPQGTPQRVKYRLDVGDLLDRSGEKRFPVVSFIPENDFDRRASA
jgi:hypothetical protein